jgi:UMF1 family MFS transporter
MKFFGLRGSRPNRGRIYAWAFYDWANSAFATTVMAGFFPLFFKQYWAGAVETTTSSFYLGIANSLASICVAILAPTLGAIADRGGTKKRFLVFFAMMGVVMTGALFLVAQGAWLMALLLYAFAKLGFAGSVAFSDALLVDVAEEGDFDLVSALGYGFGYLGGGLLFAGNVLMTLFPEFFGLQDAAEAVRVSFLSVAVWWGLFSIPVMLFVKERRPPERPGLVSSVTGGFRQLAGTFAHIRQLRPTFLFLAAYFLYIDGVDTIIVMAVDYGLSLGFQSNSLIVALLVTQFVGFPAAILFGKLGEKWGPRRGIMLAIFVYVMVILWGYQMERVWEFYGLAVTIGLVQGGIQSLSRSFYARIIPRDKSGEFFGFYNTMGKFAAVLGPGLMGWVAAATGSTRISILTILVFFITGAILLVLVDEKRAQEQARALEG